MNTRDEFLKLQVTVDTNVTILGKNEGRKGASWQQKLCFAPQIFSFHLCQHDKYRLHTDQNKSQIKQSSFGSRTESLTQNLSSNI